MTDYIAEQEMELEALESIYAGTLSEVNEEEWLVGQRTWRLMMTPLEGPDADADAGTASDATVLRMALDFAFPDAYPDNPPILRCTSLRGIADVDIAEAQAMVEGLVKENLGMPMIFTLASAAKEWIVGKFGGDGAGVEDGDGAGGGARAQDGGRDLDDEEWAARLKKRRETGTAVTADTLAEFLKRFHHSGGAVSVSEEDARSHKGEGGAGHARPTGKEFFMNGKNVEAIQASTQQADEEDEYDLDGISDLDDLDDTEEEAMLAALSVAD